ncbi:MAG: hypothetical protein WBP72_04405 [Rhodocyclaceae bacterium]
MIVRRRTWLYRLQGQLFAQTVAFDHPVTAAGARELLRRTVGAPLELWGRGNDDVLHTQNGWSEHPAGQRFPPGDR